MWTASINNEVYAKVTSANGITAKQAGASGMFSSSPRLIKYVWYHNSSFNTSLEASQQIFRVYWKIQNTFEEHICPYWKSKPSL